MADRRGLGIVGILFGGVTAAVLLTAALVTKHHMDMRADGRPPVVAASAQALVR